MATDADLHAAIARAPLSFCTLSQDGRTVTRFPESGWLEGSVTDLADLVRLISVPQSAVKRASDTLEEGIDRAERLLAETAEVRPGVARSIAGLLGMSNAPHSRRMACAIIANALIFHERLAGMYDDVKPLDLVFGRSVANPKDEITAAWDRILAINYWPIFAIARDIVGQLPAGEARRILHELRTTATDVGAAGVDNAHDLTGRVFQRLIADRKYLATFYTLPASAALLARLAVAKLEGVDWSDPDAIGKLRVADFACGTGALLSAVYEQIAARHERTGGDAASLHPVMMEEVLYGCDVMPSAIHITGSTLSGIEPAVGFENSRLYTMPYGRQEDGSVKIGSLELLQSSELMTLFNTSDPARRTGSAGEETATQINAEIPNHSFDLVIMNPPFTRAGSDWEGSSRQEDYVKQFRGLATSLDTQKEMSKRLKRHASETCTHGYAGIASAFAALADRKLRPGGVLALVMPLSAAAGISWQEFRRMLASRYTDLSVLSIAAADNDDLSFSADTGLGECLVVTRRLKPGESSTQRARFTSLHRRPQGFAYAGTIAQRIIRTDYVRNLEDGPYGGTPLTVGAEPAGEALTAQIPNDGGRGARFVCRIFPCRRLRMAYPIPSYGCRGLRRPSSWRWFA